MEGKEAVIVFDDLSRGTQVKEIAEIVLEELLSGGIGKSHIRFICAIGMHGAHNRQDFIQKLGEDIVENYPVYNHNPFFGNVKIGVDSWGNDVEINPKFMACDVRIGIGSVTPHPMNGYGGGGKLLFPGIASFNTTISNHSNGKYGIVGAKEAPGLRKEIESMTRMVGQFFKIDACINSKLDTIDIFAGDPILEYYKAIDSSSIISAMDFCEQKNVVITNANAKFNESLVAVFLAQTILKPGGDIVMINHCPCGQVVHYTFGAFGNKFGGPLFVSLENKLAAEAGRVIFYTPYSSGCERKALGKPDKYIYAKTWGEVLSILSNRGAGTTASVLADGSIGYFPETLRK